MLTSWLTVTALLAASAGPAATGRGPLTVAATCRVKGHPELELTLNCGHGGNTGVVQYWHTPFGDLQVPGLHSELDPVFMHQDGSLVVPNSSSLHSGLYYCLLQHTEGTTLWAYELHVGAPHQENQEQENQEQDSSCRMLRIRRNAASEKEEKSAGVSNGELAGAVAASVLLTFVLGFSAGALSRAHVLRCLGAISAKVRSPRPPDMPHRDSEVSMTTLPSMYDNEAFGIGQVWDGVTMETTISSTASSPPVKPQRSFRLKREEQQEIPAYLEGCDNTKEEKRGIEEQEEEEEDKAGRSLEEKKEGKKEEEREVTVLDLIGDNGGSQSETDEDKYSDKGEERDGGAKEEEEEKDAGEKENSRREDEERRGSEQEVERNREKERAEGEMDKDVSQQSETEDEEMDRKTSEDTQGGIMGGGGGGEALASLPCSARRSRIIRLYQYDEDGRRYCHLPDPAPDEPVPAPRLKQRSLSLTRLNAIMAAASAGPLDGGETRGEDQEERPHFHMEI